MDDNWKKGVEKVVDCLKRKYPEPNKVLEPIPVDKDKTVIFEVVAKDGNPVWTIGNPVWTIDNEQLEKYGVLSEESIELLLYKKEEK